jgi:hypothetical protein
LPASRLRSAAEINFDNLRFNFDEGRPGQGEEPWEVREREKPQIADCRFSIFEGRDGRLKGAWLGINFDNLRFDVRQSAVQF